MSPFEFFVPNKVLYTYYIPKKPRLSSTLYKKWYNFFGKEHVMKIEERLKNIRTDRDKTQQEIADVLKIDRKTYCRYENGMHEIKVDVLIQLAKYYNLSLDYLAGITNEERPLASEKDGNFSEKEITVIKQYRKNTALRPAVDKLLDVNKK